MSKSYIVYERPFLSVSAGLIFSLLLIGALDRFAFTDIPSGIYQAIKIFPHFEGYLNMLEQCGFNSFAGLVAESGMISLMVSLSIGSVFVLQMMLAARRRELITLEPQVAIFSTPGIRRFSKLSLVIGRFGFFFLVGWKIANIYWHARNQSWGIVDMNCSVLSTLGVVDTFKYPFLTAVSSYCFMRSMRDFVIIVNGNHFIK